MPSVSFSQQLQAGPEDAVGQPRRVFELAVAGADLEILRLQLQHHGAAGNAGLLQPRRDLFRQAAQDRHQIVR